MYIQLKGQELILNLPEKVEQYKQTVLDEINMEFGFEPISKDTIEQMNSFIINWFDQKGIELPQSNQ